MLFNAFIKTLGALKHGTFWSLLLQSILITAAILGVFIYSTVWVLTSGFITSIGWLEWLLGIIGSAGAGIIAWFLFPLLLPVIAGLFENRVMRFVEKNHYPDTTANESLPMLPALLADIRFILFALLLNLLCLPLYIIPVVNLVVYYLLNSYLLGREFFQIVAARYLDPKTTKQLRKKHRASVIGGGLLMVFAMNIPFVNLITPLLAVILMMHLFHRLQKKT